jgi:hypothetical protein
VRPTLPELRERLATLAMFAYLPEVQWPEVTVEPDVDLEVELEIVESSDDGVPEDFADQFTPVERPSGPVRVRWTPPCGTVAPVLPSLKGDGMRRQTPLRGEIRTGAEVRYADPHACEHGEIDAASPRRDRDDL